MSEELLQQGIAALKAGRKAEARHLLEQVVQAVPRSEQGWLWLSGAVDTDEERRFCLTQVLSINPRNAPAQRGLEALGPGPVLSPTRPEPHRRVEGPVRASLDEQEEPTEPSQYRQPARLSPLRPIRRAERQASASATSITCPRCDAVNPPDYRFCDRCGASLDSPALDDTQPIPVAKPPPPAGEAVPAPTLEPPMPTPPVERQPEPKEEREAGKGKWLSMGCASVVIVCFFLPWITVSCTGLQNYVETWSGYDLAAGGMNLVRTVNAGDTQVLYMIPAAAALVFIILLFSGRKRVGGGMAMIVTLLTLAAGGALASVYAAVHEEVQEFIREASYWGRAEYRLEIGLWGTIIGLVGMALGAVADAVSGD